MVVSTHWSLIFKATLYWHLMTPPTPINQTSPSDHQQSHSTIPALISFHVGGKLHKVSRSLFDMYPNTMLAWRASEQWLPDQDKEVFLEHDGDWFGLVLDNLCDDGHVILPLTVSKPSFMADLVYYGVKNVDEKKVVRCCDPALRNLINIEKRLCAKHYVVTRRWVVHHISMLFANECANGYVISGGKLQIEIYGPRVEYLEHYDIHWCPDETFRAIFSLLYECMIDGFSLAERKCNKLLVKVGLKIIHLNYIALTSIIEVSMELTERVIGISSSTDWLSSWGKRII